MILSQQQIIKKITCTPFPILAGKRFWLLVRIINANGRFLDSNACLECRGVELECLQRRGKEWSVAMVVAGQVGGRDGGDV